MRRVRSPACILRSLPLRKAAPAEHSSPADLLRRSAGRVALAFACLAIAVAGLVPAAQAAEPDAAAVRSGETGFEPQASADAEPDAIAGAKLAGLESGGALEIDVRHRTCGGL